MGASAWPTGLCLSCGTIDPERLSRDRRSRRKFPHHRLRGNDEEGVRPAKAGKTNREGVVTNYVIFYGVLLESSDSVFPFVAARSANQ